MQKYNAIAEAQRKPLRVKNGKGLNIPELIRLGSLAASSHNTQPWKIRIEGQALEIFPDLSRRCPVVDPNDAHLFKSLGCMAENIRIAAASQGYVADISFREDSGMVRLEFLTSTSAESDDLFSAILKRQCTKTPFSGKPLEPDHRRALELSARGNGVRTIIMEDKSRLETIIEFVAQGNGEQLSDPAFQKELASWIRFNPAVAIKFKDGLAGHLAGQPPLPQWLGKALLNFVLTPKNQSDTDAVNIRSSAAVVVFITEDDNPPAWVEVGRVYERFALKACALGIRNAFINQPIEVRKILPELNSWLGLEKGKASLVIRIGYGTEAPFSLRRPVEEIIIQDNAM